MDEHERMVFFEVWDTEVHLMIDDFDSLDMALEMAREMIALDPHKYPAYLAIAQVNEDETTTWLAKGDSLVLLLESQSNITGSE